MTNKNDINFVILVRNMVGVSKLDTDLALTGKNNPKNVCKFTKVKE